MINRAERNLLYGANLWYLGEGMLGPLFAIFSESVGGNILDITWAWAVYLIITGILSILFGRFADSFNKEKMIFGGYILNAIFTFCYLLVSSPLQLMLVQAGLGVASAMAASSWYALYAKHEDRRHDGYAWGLVDGNYKITTGVAIIIGGLIVNYFSFRVLFVTMGIVQVIAVYYQAKMLKNSY